MSKEASYTINADWRGGGFATCQPYTYSGNGHALLVPFPNEYSKSAEEFELTPREKAGLYNENVARIFDREGKMVRVAHALRGRTVRGSYDWDRQWAERAIGDS